MSSKPKADSQRWLKHLAWLNDHRKRLTGECCEVTGIVILFIVLAVAGILFVALPAFSLLIRGVAYFIHVTGIDFKFILDFVDHNFAVASSYYPKTVPKPSVGESCADLVRILNQTLIPLLKKGSCDGAQCIFPIA